MNAKFRYNNEAKIAASKAYLLAEYILERCYIINDDLIYSADKLKKLNTKLPEDIKYLEKLKRLNTEAYYYLVLTTIK